MWFNFELLLYKQRLLEDCVLLIIGIKAEHSNLSISFEMMMQYTVL